MGIFGDLDVQAAEDDPFFVPANTYVCTLYKAEVKRDKNDNLGMSLIYKIAEGEHKNKTVSEWKKIPQPADPKNLTEEEQRDASYLKMRLKSLGVPENRMNDVNIDDLLGLDVIVTVVQNGEYTNVKKVELYEGSDMADNDADNGVVRFG